MMHVSFEIKTPWQKLLMGRHVSIIGWKKWDMTHIYKWEGTCNFKGDSSGPTILIGSVQGIENIGGCFP